MPMHPIVVKQFVRAQTDNVWRAITDPHQMQQWFFAEMADFRPEVGFETEFNVRNYGQIYPHQWTVTAVDPGASISYDWRYGGFPGDSTVTWELAETAVGTEVTLTHRGHETLLTSAGTPQERRRECEAGWIWFVRERLPAFLEQT